MKKKDRFFVYKITNTVTGDLYFGYTSQNPPSKRWGQHKTSGSGKTPKGCLRLSQSMIEHGIDAFKWEVHSTWKTSEKAFYVEAYLICTENSTLNDAAGGGKFYQHSEESLAKITAASTGKVQSPETIEKRRSKIKGLKRSEDHCEMKRNTPELWIHLRSPEVVAKQAASARGTPKPGTSRGLKGKPKSQEHCNNISKARTGMKFSTEHCENIRRAQKKLVAERWLSKVDANEEEFGF